MIPRIDAQALAAGDPGAVAATKAGAQEIGFLTVYNTALTAAEVEAALDAYRGFFKLPVALKEAVNMDRTKSNRGWGAQGSEQVDPDANPDYKQVFDCGFELPAGHPLAARDLKVYAANQWPDGMPAFQRRISDYYAKSLVVAKALLGDIIAAVGGDARYFEDAFSAPMALLRGNYYPERPAWAGEKDFGIATHTDYGCLTLLATDGSPGLEVRKRGGGWIPVSAPPGEFVINFGEMIEMWTNGAVRATPHRVVGGDAERLSIPLFFNPNYDVNVAPIGSGEVIEAGVHLTKRFNETYVHLKGD
ncbi:isopenicillin N synthase-like dioxygenase [Litoreibacter ponti]|uniref:2-oxoglutarate-dependent ethylene/succinate-forming enzyme n=1 Tax=Litoreibacter ponti TaxID=1510457 RepID=A0A2T6BKC7_9RHOB|nr:2OG-Fe(II) oxygenase family protein [Litoreibacter ponti]PTX56519.1 isopenicillin N synthase-like dioxygenase [Litoreibacter ponti]